MAVPCCLDTTYQTKVLYDAIKADNLEVLKSLLDLSLVPDIDFFEYSGETPIGLALTENKQDLLPLLLSKTDKYFALHIAVKLKKDLTIQYLLEKCQFKNKFLQFLGLN